MAREFPLRRAILWIRRVLEINVKTDVPESITNTVTPTLDLFGWELLKGLEREVVAAAGAVSAIALPIVPAGEAHFYMFADISHNDAANPHEINIQYRATGSQDVSITPTQDLAAGFLQSFTRPTLVLAGDRLLGVAQTAIPGGSTFTMRGKFLRMQIGEYVPGSPYG